MLNVIFGREFLLSLRLLPPPLVGTSLGIVVSWLGYMYDILPEKVAVKMGTQIGLQFPKKIRGRSLADLGKNTT